MVWRYCRQNWMFQNVLQEKHNSIVSCKILYILISMSHSEIVHSNNLVAPLTQSHDESLSLHVLFLLHVAAAVY